jgi:TonB family protein
MSQKSYLLAALISCLLLPGLSHAQAAKRKHNTKHAAPKPVKPLIVDPCCPPDPPPPPPTFHFVEQMPVFPGDIQKFIKENLKYPDSSLNAGIEGRVVVQFVVKEDGSLANATVVRGVNVELDHEALRLISIMPRWQPGRQGGKPVDVMFTLPITFRID